MKIWIESVDFDNYGGWCLDSQYIHKMGSPYLLAPYQNGGLPAGDAVTTISVPETGSYRLWVRCRNWIKGHGPGRFQVALDGRSGEAVFGNAHTDAWTWEKGDLFELTAGEHTLSLQDRTGWFTRCNALVLSSEADYVPSNDPELIRRERLESKGLKPEASEGGSYDFIVVGGGPGGFPAALQAARLGLKTLLIQDRPVLGGNAGPEIEVPIDGANSRQLNARETGIAEEIFWKVRNSGKDYDTVFRQMASEEEHLTIVVNQRVIAAETAAAGSGKSIRAVTARNTMTTEDTVYRSGLFLDATGDGWLGHFAGADAMFGREGASEFGETMAPEKADHLTMSGCLRGPFRSERIRKTDRAVAFKCPGWAEPFSDAFESYREIPDVRDFYWWLEHSNELDDVAYPEECRDELIKIYVSYWDYIKNRWSRKEEADNFELVYIPFINGRREGQRLTGPYVLSEADCAGGRDFEDTIAYSGWPIDLHHPKGVYSGEEGPYFSNMDVPLVKIPYRCLYSRNVDNLFMAGRNISVTHVALGTVRVEGQCAITGQAAGVAASLCRKYGTSPDGIYQDHLKELQQLCLKEDLYLPGVINEDPEDLALQAEAKASSINKWEQFKREKGEPCGWPQLGGCWRAIFFPLEQTLRIDSLWIRLRNDADQPRQLKLHVFQDDSPGMFSSDYPVGEAQAEIGPHGETWVEFPVNKDFTMKYAWVYLDPAEDVFIQRRVSGKLDTYLAWKHDFNLPWTIPPRHQYYAFSLEKPLVEFADGGPGNVNNGWNRVIDPEHYMWISEPNDDFPQWLELDFGSEKEFDTVHLVFDTDLNVASMNGKRSTKYPPRCVSDYNLEVYDRSAGQWVTVVEYRDNWLRKRVHSFPLQKASRLRVKVLNTIADYSARIVEVRVYKEH
ncbi:MAG: FAD-dependent oxidoreductase [Spirochaetales bacterium]|nr:FAD-dependent oxidoreductase [Spirochaetales bacterium]